MTASQLVPVVPGTIDNVQCLTVDGRALHGALGVRRDFSNWIKGRISKYGFVQGQDFEVFSNSGKNSELDSPNLANQKKHGGDRRSLEYRCSLDMGKELCMVENNEKGRIARRYFIECERRLLAADQAAPDSGLSPSLRAELKAIVDAKLSTHPASVQGKARAEIWTRFNRHFSIAEYAQLPAERMPEARDLLIEMRVRALAELPPSTPSTDRESVTVPPAAPGFREDLPADMDAGRKDALKKIQRLTWGVHAALDVVRMFCNPKYNAPSGAIPLEIALNLYRSAEANLVAAYNDLEAGYRLGHLYEHR